MNSRLLISVLLALFGSFSCEDIEHGPCGNPQVQPDFDLKKFAGRWYEIEDYREGLNVVKINKCNNVNYEIIDDKTINITSSYVTGILGRTKRTLLQGTIDDEDQPAKWTVWTRPELNETIFGEYEHLYLYYYILETDYSNYALVWACTGTRNHHHVYSYILSKTRTLPADTLETIRSNVSKYGLKKSYFHRTNQKNCK